MEALAKRFNELKKSILNREFSRMNDMQRSAVFHTSGPLLILAGAGSGKTTVLVNRIANLINYGDAYNTTEVDDYITQRDIDVLEKYNNGDKSYTEEARSLIARNPVPAWKILAITFTNKAANELKSRIDLMVGDDMGSEIWASTFHSSCARMLRKDAERLGFSNHFTIYDSDDSKRLMKDVLKALKMDEKEFPVKSVLNEISRAKDELLSPSAYRERVNAGTDHRRKRIAEAYKMYQQKLKEADAMDFDDLLFFGVALLRDNPDVLQYYQNRFSHIMVDEYQDTNHAQYEWVRLLADKRKNLCVVGDDDQSIYKFRGANIENILNFEDGFQNCKVVRLEQNYRSTQNILDVANAVIANNVGRKGKTLWTQNPAGEKVEVRTVPDEQSEGKYIADKILDGVRGGAHFSDYAILYRMNAQSNTIEKSMIRAGVPYRIIGGHRYYERKEVRDMIAYLSVIANPNDTIRLRRIINEPKRGIGDKTVSTAEEIASVVGMSLFEVLCNAQEFAPLKRSAQKLQEFTDIILQLRDKALSEDVMLDELYNELIDKIGYVAYLKEQNDEAETRIENINELTTNLKQYQNDNEDATLTGFLEEVSLLTDIDNYNSENDSVVLMTLHSAKGLEFPYVFMPGMEEGIFPNHQIAMESDSELEEERRLAYVGITRAEKKLTIVNAQTRMIYGETRRNKVSRFVREIPEELINAIGAYPTGSSVKQSSGVAEPQYKSYIGNASSIGISSSAARTSTIKKASCDLNVGDVVEHKTFGEGMVLSAKSVGNDTLLEVAFDTVGTKKLFAAYANLKKKM